MSQTVPVISLTDFASNDPVRQQIFVQTLGQALEEIGFLALTDHGISSVLIQSAYDAAEAVFSLSDVTKARYEDLTLKGQRGFTAFGREHAKDFPYPDLKEFWHVGRETATPTNIWPAECVAFKLAMVTLFEHLERCAQYLLEACALYLELPRTFLCEMTTESPTLLRVIHYPPVLDGNGAGLRAAPHEDINLITLLCEATAPGLELRQKNGTWLPIAAIPGQIIVDTGDMLQNLTNGRFKSTTHRVINPENECGSRFSLPFFVHPRPEVELSPLPKCVANTDGQPRFPNITAGDYLSQRLQEIGLG